MSEQTNKNKHTTVLSQDEKNITQKQTILVVDDSTDYLKIVLPMLEHRYNLVLAKSGETALRLLQRNMVDIILLDIEMPGMSGLDFFNILRNHPIYNLIPVVFVTSHTQSDIITRAIELGAKGYVVKPFTEQALMVKITPALKLRAGKMAMIDMTMQLITIENCFTTMQRIRNESKDPAADHTAIWDLYKKIIGIFAEMLKDKEKYIFPVYQHLNRIYVTIKDGQLFAMTDDRKEYVLTMIQGFIDELGVRDLAVIAADLEHPDQA
jgi:CheY-like chemotaxis protein